MNAANPIAGVASPCTSVCRMHPESGWCVGCWRNIGEIVAWARMSDDQKRHVWAQLPQRGQSAEPRHGMP